METIFINPERCIGCRSCEVACAVEHSRSRDPVRALAEDPVPKSRIHVMAGPWLNSAFPSMCRHCDPAPCQAVCPTGAVHREPDHDRVLVAAGKCIACAMCAMVCPFDVITFHAHADGLPRRVVATKCDGCVARLDRGEAPACVEACKSGALVYGELNALIAAGRARAGGAVLTTLARTETQPITPDAIAGWRAWGAAATSLAKGVAHER